MSSRGLRIVSILLVWFIIHFSTFFYKFAVIGHTNSWTGPSLLRVKNSDSTKLLKGHFPRVPLRGALGIEHIFLEDGCPATSFSISP